LPADHPITAPAYSERRSTMAKRIGLGRKPQEAVVSTPEVVAAPSHLRPNTGNFIDSGLRGASMAAKRALNQSVMSQFPTHPNREFFAALQGI
jgi:hypothetical protein